MPNITLRQLRALNETDIAGLADVLIDCVEGGASVGFMLPMTRDKAIDFWTSVDNSLRGGQRVLLAADVNGCIVGTVQLVFDLPENQPYRADVSKMLVHRSHRRSGVGRLLMTAVQELAKQLGRTLLVLDTANPGAEALYRQSGWIAAGAIPNFALMPDGAPCATVIMYRDLGREDASR